MSQIEKAQEYALYLNTIKDLRFGGATLQEIGDKYSLSRERIRQICKEHSFEKKRLWTQPIDPYKKYRDRVLSYSVANQKTRCWEWVGGRDKLGYGRMSFLGKGDYAHRVSYEVYKGRIPPGLCVCHQCDNPSCVNPNHLWVGTQGENIRDRDRKGRGKNGMNQNLRQ